MPGMTATRERRFGSRQAGSCGVFCPTPKGDERVSEVPGQRPVLFLLPGLLCDATVFAPAIEHFGDGAEIVVPNFHDLDSIAAMADSVLAAAPDRFSVAGFSMGGRVAFQIASVAPERVARLCVFDTGAGAATPAEGEMRKKLVALGRDRGMAAVAETWLPTMVHPSRAEDRAFLRPLQEMVRRASADVLERQVQALLTRPDATPVLSTIRCPALVMGGQEDAGVPPARHEEIAAAIPGARLRLIPQSGHFLPVEQPAPFAAELRAWLARPD